MDLVPRPFGQWTHSMSLKRDQRAKQNNMILLLSIEAFSQPAAKCTPFTPTGQQQVGTFVI